MSRQAHLDERPASGPRPQGKGASRAVHLLEARGERYPSDILVVLVPDGLVRVAIEGLAAADGTSPRASAADTAETDQIRSAASTGTWKVRAIQGTR